MPKTSRKQAIDLLLLALVCLISLGLGPINTRADTAATTATTNSLQDQINQRTNDIQNLEKEIAAYQSQLDDLSGQADSLSATIKSLDLNQRKLQASIALTKDQINDASAKLNDLNGQIGDTESSLSDNQRAVAEAFMSMAESDNRSLTEIILSSQSINQTWQTVNNLAELESNLQKRINRLSSTKANLESTKTSVQKARAKLIALQNQLRDQRNVVLATQNEKSQLLSETKDSEAAYQAILANKKALKDAFEQELLQYGNQLQLNVSSTSLPPSGSAPLNWPVDKVFITQYFGNTPFATANSQIYNGFGHDGVDFRASIGTPIKAALTGVVVGEANTDLVPGCYSFGRWIMIKHPDGLSTLYAHLSLSVVNIGDMVSTGQIIGYSGNTGYTTGPHLHFGVYATAGVSIQKFTTSKHCQGATVPLATLSAYLNPLSYLPKMPY